MRWLFAILSLLPCHVFAQSQYAAISSVSVDTASARKVTITWDIEVPSDSHSYTIYRWSDSKWVLVADSLPGSMRSYQDVVAHPTEHAERYSMSTSIVGQSDSPLSDSHQTVFLSCGEYDKCSQSLMLEWSAYVGADVVDYMIFGKKEGEPFALYGKTTDTVFSTSALLPGEKYRFYVVANLQESYRSMSNMVDYETFNPKLLDESLVSVDSVLNVQGKVELTASIDTSADLLGYAIQKSVDADFVSDTMFSGIKNKRLSYVPVDADATYRLSAIGFCGDPVYSSAEVRPLSVEAEAGLQSISVRWRQSLGAGEKFTVYCAVDGGAMEEVASFLDDCAYDIAYDDIADDQAQNFCVMVESARDSAYSRSNTVCVERQPDVELANAFTPNGDGVNDTFGPIIRSAQIKTFEFAIYDRYGGRVYSTADQFSRWDGKCGGKHVAEGGYLYYLKIVTTQNQTIERKGSVNVVYP